MEKLFLNRINQIGLNFQSNHFQFHFQQKQESKSQGINKSFKFNSKTISHCLAISKIKFIRACRLMEKVTKKQKRIQIVNIKHIDLTKI